MEKKESTPDQYPLTLNALRNACNQKSSRNPVVNYNAGEVGHAIRELEAMGLVREEWGARAPRYEHLVNKGLNLHSKGIALICTLMLRGPQTLGELRNNSVRLFEFDDLDDVQYALNQLLNSEPPMVTALPRQTGQKEGRFAHLLCGEPEIPATVQTVASPPLTAQQPTDTELQEKVARLEAELEDVRDRLESIEKRFN
jgi:uncharacterized protein YceH (UPF0502 family)